MKDFEQLMIQAAITQRIQSFAQLNDAGQFQTLADFFSEDAEYARPSQPEDILRGKSQILASFLNRPARKTRHVVSHVMIRCHSAEQVSAHSQILLFIADQEHPDQFNRLMVGGFHDELILQQRQWYFKKRIGYLDFAKTLS